MPLSHTEKLNKRQSQQAFSTLGLFRRLTEMPEKSFCAFPLYCALFAPCDAVFTVRMFSHSRDFHIKCANRLCRVCGLRVEKRHNKWPEPKPCRSYATSLLQTFDIDITGVSGGTHPSMVCVKCYYKMINAPKRAKDVSQYISSDEKGYCQHVNQLWKPWTADVWRP